MQRQSTQSSIFVAVFMLEGLSCLFLPFFVSFFSFFSECTNLESGKIGSGSMIQTSSKDEVKRYLTMRQKRTKACMYPIVLFHTKIEV